MFVTEPKWKRFEKLAFEIQKDLAADAEVKLNDTIFGQDSQTDRQIDISIRKSVGQFPLLVVIECKDHAEPVDVKDMEAFSGVVHDVRASRGAMIVSSGFTKAALTLAANRGIDAYRLLDTASVDWKTYIALPMLLRRTYIKSFAFAFSGFGKMALPASTEELYGLEWSSPDGVQLGSAIAMIHRKWDKAEMPRTPGKHEVPLGNGLRATFAGVDNYVDIKALVTVDTTHYFGPQRIETRGLVDSQTDAVITKSFRTHSIEPKRIEKGLEPGWRQIEDPNELAVVKPKMTLVYSDVYTDEEFTPDSDSEEFGSDTNC